MLVPNFWAEAKLKEKIGKRSVTIKRFGWSDISEEDALSNAKERVFEAMERAKCGEAVRLVDHKRSYNGAEGLPIREEVISRQEGLVITRNAYGSLCLNTPDVLFVDIDFEESPSRQLYFSSVGILFILGIFSAVYLKSVFAFFITLILSFVFAHFLSEIVIWIRNFVRGGIHNIVINRIKRLSMNNPEMHLRVYRTPVGFRVLVMHKRFNPDSEEVSNIFNELGADKLYSAMCRNQKCFRARISPKPWRIGLNRIGPRPGVWPIKAERMPDRRKWVEAYDAMAKNFASCRFEAKFGSEQIDQNAATVCKIHDMYCKSESNLKIA